MIIILVDELQLSGFAISVETSKGAAETTKAYTLQQKEEYPKKGNLTAEKMVRYLVLVHRP